jgi:hypothetical protein
VKNVLVKRHKKTQSSRSLTNTFKRSFAVFDIFENNGQNATQFLPYSNIIRASFVLVTKYNIRI